MLRPSCLTRQFHQYPSSLLHHAPSSPLRPLSLLRPLSIASPPRIWPFQFPGTLHPLPCSIRRYSTPPRPSPSSPSHSRPLPPPGTVIPETKPKTHWTKYVFGVTLDTREKILFWQFMRKYTRTGEFWMRVIYRMLLILVIVYPIWVFSGGPIKINHRDGEYEAFNLVSRREVAKDHYELVLKRKVTSLPNWNC